MKKLTFLILCAVVLALSACKGDGGNATVSNEEPVRIGFMICDSYELSKERFGPFAAYLSEKTGRKFEMILANTFEFEDLIQQKCRSSRGRHQGT